MGGGSEALEGIVAAELARPAPTPAVVLADAIRRRHGETVAAVLFYGSCLRKGTAEGVLDFYVLVDSYGDAYASRWLARANAWLPPNVLYLEAPHAGGTLRVKYAVVSREDFAKCAAGRGLDARIWARFSQPALLVFARDDAARRDAVSAVAQAIRTFVGRLQPLLPATHGVQRVAPAELWRTGLRETYRAELRSEAAASIDALYASDPARYDRVTVAALRELSARGQFDLHEAEGGGLTIDSDGAELRRARRAWRLRRPLAKVLAVLGLLKTAATFDDWVSYVVWKLERHSGQEIALTERQRRHPLVFGWPVIFRLLRERVLR